MVKRTVSVLLGSALSLFGQCTLFSDLLPDDPVGIAGVCAPGFPDCEDTIVVNGTGGDDGGDSAR